MSGDVGETLDRISLSVAPNECADELDVELVVMSALPPDVASRLRLGAYAALVIRTVDDGGRSRASVLVDGVIHEIGTFTSLAAAKNLRWMAIGFGWGIDHMERW